MTRFCGNVDCLNPAAVVINGDPMCGSCARQELSADAFNNIVKCCTEGCINQAADDIRYSGMCTFCYRKDCEEGIVQAEAMNENMRKRGTIDAPRLYSVQADAKAYFEGLTGSAKFYVKHQERTTGQHLMHYAMMIAPYGGSPESIYAALGHTKDPVSLEDCQFAYDLARGNN